jgi:hypothetical protein
LVVWDGKSSSEPAFKSITATANPLYDSSNPAPKAEFKVTGHPFSTGRIITLDGKESYDPDGDPLSYGWFFAHKPLQSKVQLSTTPNDSICFAPDVEGEYQVGLIVNDGKHFSQPRLMTILVKNEIDWISYFLTFPDSLRITCYSTMTNLKVEYGADTNYGSTKT